MAELTFSYLSIAVAAPLAAAAAAGRLAGLSARGLGLLGAAASALVSVGALRQVVGAQGSGLREPMGLFAADGLNAIPLVLYPILVLAVLAMAPARDLNTAYVRGAMILLAGTQAAYASSHLLGFAVAWAFSAVPFVAGPFTSPGNWRPRVAMIASSVATLFACLLMGGGPMSDFRGSNPGGMAAFLLLLLAIIFRKGIFPAHAWVEEAADHGTLLPTALLLNGHLGGFALARIVIPAFPQTSDGLFPVLSDFALFTAIYAAVRALAEQRLRRTLALLALSQAACILAGLESGSQAGITGALVHWIVVSISTTALFGVVRMLEARFGFDLTTGRYLGLGEYTPRLAVFFAVAGLALVGLPGTLGFAAEDLLIHGALESHPQLGLLLPLATAMNAFTVFRLFSRLFLGNERTGYKGASDALPRERWALTAAIVFLVLGGLAPGAIISDRASAAHTMDQFLQAKSMTRP